MHQNLTILHLNINGLRNKIHEVANILDKFQPSIMALSESKLDDSISDGLLHISGYNLLRLDRPNSKGGGLVVYYQTHIPISLNTSSLAACESLSMEVSLSRRKSLRLLLVYRPPCNNVHNFITSLDQFLSGINHSIPLLIIGDLNIDFLDNSSNVVNIQKYS